MTKKLKKTVLWTYVIRDLNDREIVGMFCEKELKKRSNQNNFINISRGIKSLIINKITRSFNILMFL